MKKHSEFMEDVEHAKALPAQTCRALGPESDEDISMYADDSQLSKVEKSNKNLQEKRDYTHSLNGRRDTESGAVVESPASISPADTQTKDAVYTTDEGDKK